MENWYLVSFKFLDTGLWFYNLVLTDREEKIIKHFSKHEEMSFRKTEKREVKILRKAKLPIVDLAMQ